MKAKRILSGIIAASMLTGFAAMPVYASRSSSANTDYYVAENTADKLYFEAEDIVTSVVNTDKTFQSNYGVTHQAPDSSADMAGNTAVSENKIEITLSFDSDVTGYYTFATGAQNPFNNTYAGWDLYINGEQYPFALSDCFASDGAPMDAARSGNSWARVVIDNVLIVKGTNTITYKSNNATFSGTSAQYKLFVDFIGLSLKELTDDPTEVPTTDPSATEPPETTATPEPTAAPTPAPLQGKLSTDNTDYYVSENTSDKMYFEAEAIVDSVSGGIPKTNGSTYKVTYHAPDSVWDMAGSTGVDGNEKEIVLSFESPKSGIYTFATGGSNPFNPSTGGWELYINDTKYEFSMENDCFASDGARMNAARQGNSWARVVIDGVGINEGTNTIRYKSVNKGTNGYMLFVDFIGLSYKGEATEAPTADPSATEIPTADPSGTEQPTAQPEQTPVPVEPQGKVSTDNADYYVAENTAEKMYFEAEDIVESVSGGIPEKFRSSYKVTYHVPGSYADMAGSTLVDDTEKEITLSFDSPQTGTYTLAIGAKNPFNPLNGGYEIYVNDVKYDFAMETDCYASDGARMNEARLTNGWARVVLPKVSINNGKNTIRFRSATKGTNGYMLFVDFIGLSLRNKPADKPDVIGIEGEDVPGVTVYDMAAASGGKVGGFIGAADGAEISFDFEAAQKGDYELEFVTSNANSAEYSPYDVYLNGEKISYELPEKSGSQLSRQTAHVKLMSGRNNIRFVAAAKAGDDYTLFLDRMSLEYSEDQTAPARTITIEGESAVNAFYTKDGVLEPITTGAISLYSTNATGMLEPTEENIARYGADKKFNPASGGMYLYIRAQDKAVPVVVNYQFNVETAGEYEIFVDKSDDDNNNLTLGQILVEDTQFQISSANAVSVEQIGYVSDFRLQVKRFRMKDTVTLEPGTHSLTVIVDEKAAGRSDPGAIFTLDKIDLVKKVEGTEFTMYTRDHSVKVGKTTTVMFEDSTGLDFTGDNVDSVTYESSDERIAVVSDGGVITGVNPGDCEIKAKFAYNDEVYELSARIIVCDEHGLVIDSVEQAENGIKVVFAAASDDDIEFIAAGADNKNGIKTALRSCGITPAELIPNIYQSVVIPVDNSAQTDFYELFIWDGADTMRPLYKKLAIN